jgi:hypothetical protein
MATGSVEREFALHTFPVRGIEWTGLNSILSHVSNFNHVPDKGLLKALKSFFVSGNIKNKSNGKLVKAQYYYCL